MSRISARLLLLIVLLALANTSSSLADDAFTDTNPSTGQTESVWSAVPLGGSVEIFFAILQGTEWTPSEQLTSDGSADQNPHLAFTASGDREVTWWKDASVDTVFFSSKAASGGSWTSSVEISDGVENARGPRAIVFGGAVFVAYEGVPSSGSRKVIVSKQENPDPWSRTLVATSGQTDALSVRLHSDSGHLWIDWLDSSSYLGWSEYVSGSWGSTGYESYSGTSDIGAGRGRIRNEVLGN